MTNRDYYEILGIDRNASDKDVRRAFKRLAREHHPDVADNKEEAELIFREINEAYAVLSDSEKRGMYDQLGHAAFSRAGGSPGFTGGWPFGGGFSSGGGFGDMEDIFEMFFDMGGGFGTGSRRGRTQNAARRGRDLRKDVEIELEDAYRGIEMDFTVESYQICPVCNGRRIKPGTNYKVCPECQGSGTRQSYQNTLFGQVQFNTTCSHCDGEGRFPEVKCEECHAQGRTIRKEKISVKIPSGVADGMRMRVPEKGEAGQYGGPMGDLYVFIHVNKHDIFKRNGNNLLVELPIGFADAALGTEKEIETFDGTEKLRIPEGIQTGTVLKIRGKGMPDLRSGKPGDIEVKITVITPTKLTDSQRKLLCEFAEEGPQFHCEKKGFFRKIFEAMTGKS